MQFVVSRKLSAFFRRFILLQKTTLLHNVSNDFGGCLFYCSVRYRQPFMNYLQINSCYQQTAGLDATVGLLKTGADKPDTQSTNRLYSEKTLLKPRKEYTKKILRLYKVCVSLGNL